MIQSALGRKSSAGYFFTSRPKDIIASHHSGNIGTYLGRFKSIKRQGRDYYGTIALKQDCEIGDRFRLHFDASGERISFTAKEISRVNQQKSILLLPSNLKPGQLKGKVELYRVDVRKEKRVIATDAGKTPKINKFSATEKKQIKARARRISNLFSVDPILLLNRRNPQALVADRKSHRLNCGSDLIQSSPYFTSFLFSVDRFVFTID